jgi:hypothetical protein
MPRVIGAMTRPLGPAPKAAASENGLHATDTPGVGRRPTWER